MMRNPSSTASATSDAADGDQRAFAAFCEAGSWPGCGSTLARQVVAAGFVHPDEVTPAGLAELAGVGDRRARRLVGALDRARPAFDATVVLLDGGAPAQLASRAIRRLGPGAAAALRDDPWRLLELSGVDPAESDRFARRLLESVAADDPRRGRALVGYLLGREARLGHTTTSAAALHPSLEQLDTSPDAALTAALDGGDVLSVSDDGTEAGVDETWLALARHAMAEDTLALGLHRLRTSAEALGEAGIVDEVTTGLDPAQLDAVRAVATHGVTVLTGGPGTGKSRTVDAVVQLADAVDVPVALAAPTGRAAKRLEELTGHEATTLHRLLGAYPAAFDDGGDFAFARGEAWPLDASLVVVDEVSMLDVELAAALVDACADGVHLMLVGDPAQLPSIGPGRVLADIIESATVPVTQLTTLHRQESGGAIARLATSVRDGVLPPVNAPDHEVVVVPARAAAEAAHRVVQLVTDSIPRTFSLAPDEVQVVTPVHRGAAGTVALNKALKERLNPGRGEHRGFDLGDRVVATANHPEVGFANGEVGAITAVEDGGLAVGFATGTATVPFKLLGDLLHGWAITVHRAQGSEWAAVVCVLPREATGMLSRPLVYTAFTRAERHLSVVHAAGPALAHAVRRVGERPRRTRLAALLHVDADADAESE